MPLEMRRGAENKLSHVCAVCACESAIASGGRGRARSYSNRLIPPRGRRLLIACVYTLFIPVIQSRTYPLSGNASRIAR